MNDRARRHGFTIVELLIVIVVIAILAVISIVAYNGIQTRAENGKTISAINAYINGLTIYKTINNGFPTAGAMCLGEDYPMFTGGTAPACRYQSAPIAQTTNAAARDALKQVMGSTLPMPSKKLLTTGSNEFVGAYFYGTTYNLTLDGESVVAVTYTYDGSDCPVGPSYQSTGYPDFSSANKGPYAAAGTGVRCMVLLPV